MSASISSTHCDAVPSVEVRHACKSYGRGKNKVPVLNDLSLTVPCGAIYGLLGPSGCGKTTLLRCILGQLKVDKGSVTVFGRTPGDRKYGVPGHLVGYMPQELALFQEFTIGETLSFYGRIHGMTSQDIRQRTDFLIDFLTLPSRSRLVSQLSGGQKRRVSLAAALLQQPLLLILDEPTVGVDPVLREKIWQHLLEIAQSAQQKTTIIITTHYVEEARQADRVGLMRNGHLLAENSPTRLLEQYNVLSLEKLFLYLCERDSVIHDEEVQDGNVTNILITTKSTDSLTPSDARSLPYSEQVPDHDGPGIFVDDAPTYAMHSGWSCCDILRCKNILALIIKNLTVMKRRIGFLLFEFFLPALQIVLFCLCIGRDPYNLHMGIVNKDSGHLGQLFLSYLDNDTITQVPYDTLPAAIDSVKSATSWGAMFINSSFSQDIILRFISGMNATNATIDGSSIQLHLDMTNQQISISIQERVNSAFFSFYRELLNEAHVNPRLASLPVELEEPVYGSLKPSFTNFMAPGMILSIMYFMATGLTALSFVIEKIEGLLDRSFTAGVTSIEIMLAHVLTQLLILSVQVTLLLLFALEVFDIPFKGPLIWVILLVLIQGFTGMCLGMLISVSVEQLHEAIQLSLASLFPNLLLSGLIWPLEAIPHWLWYISICLPMTYPAETLRSVFSRGWGIEHTAVWRGYLVTIGWSIGFLLLAAVVLKIKQ